MRGMVTKEMGLMGRMGIIKIIALLTHMLPITLFNPVEIDGIKPQLATDEIAALHAEKAEVLQTIRGLI